MTNVTSVCLTQARAQTCWGAGAQTPKKGPHPHVTNTQRGGGGGAAGARERRGACRGETQINAPSDIKKHLGGIDDSHFYS